MDFLRQSQLPNKPRPPQGAQSSMGNFPTLQAYQQQQDAFVQQHLKNQAQYNQGLQSGQSPQRVPVMEAWKQAGENIQSGQYQGNPFQTGNVDAIMGMFGQYGMQAPQGFRDQLLQNLGQQSAPPMYQPQPGMGYPGGPMQPPAAAPGYPKFTNPATGLPYGQPVTDGPIGPNGEYWPGFRSPPAMPYPGGPMQPQPAMGSPGGPMPPGQMPSNDGFIDAREPGMRYQAVMVPYYNPATGETTHRTAGVVPAPGSGWVRGAGPSAGQPQPPTSMQPVAPPAMTYPGGPMKPPAPAPQPWQMGQQPQMTYPGGPMQPPVNPPAPAVDSFEAHMASWTPPKAPAWGWGSPQQQQDAERQSRVEHMQNYKAPAVAPGQAQPMPPRQQVMPTPPSTLPGGPSNDFIPRFTNPATGLPYGQRPRDLVGDWGFGDYGPEPPRTPDQQRMDAMIRQQAEAAVMPPNPSDPWSYPLLPGHTRGPSGEQIMSSDARQAEIRRREQESGLTYVTRQDGKGGSWVRATKPNPKASISLNPEQAAGMKQYMESRQASRAQPTPPRTQGTPYRGGRR